jgi:endogenous inhibitor of DNA gyrase (YacG/DUF329 family)
VETVYQVRLGYGTSTFGGRQVKTCKHCGKQFAIGPSQSTKLFCTSECSKNYHRPSVPIRIVVITPCLECGDPVPHTVKGDKRYCTARCRNRARKRRFLESRKGLTTEIPRLKMAPPQKRIWD